MTRRVMLGLSVFSLLVLTFALVAGPVAADEDVHWSYEGDDGPDNWGSLSPEFVACADGVEQSPVDIPASATVNDADITFNYQPSDLTIVNNGHTIQANYDTGSSITLDGKQYDLLQFHFHALSEHTLGGSASPMEMHLVHKAADGELAVVGVMLESGAENAAFAAVMDNLPAEAGDPMMVDGATVDAADLLPADQSYYHYHGSLTTPPCSEGVMWQVMTTAVELSADQIAAYTAIYDANARPVQPMNERDFLTAGAEMAAEETTAEAPAKLPKTGVPLLPLDVLFMGLGALSAGVGLLRRRSS